MKYNLQDYIRIVLEIMLYVLVWYHEYWATALTITLIGITVEGITEKLRRQLL